MIQLRGEGDAVGEVFYTLSPGQNSIRGKRISFDVPGDENDWQDINLKIHESQRVYQLRIDPRETPGEMTCKSLRLIGQNRALIGEWPKRF
jgi:hypothetical protein